MILILLNEISKEIEKNKSESLLDIGAGNGLLSIPLSKKVNKYLAIEPNKNFIVKLRENGVSVLEGAFPMEVPETFDIVLASHSISYQKNSLEEFIREGWKAVKPGGIFLIITYRGQEDDWTRLMKNLGENHEDRNRVVFGRMIQTLSSLGRVKTRKVITKVKTENLEDMVQSLMFVASGGKREKKEQFFKKKSQLVKILKHGYQDKNGYFFPFQHFFITTQKQ